ncbi:MAG: aldehyde dehydrogenase family protein [Candidatus Acidiferrales bacterium]
MTEHSLGLSFPPVVDEHARANRAAVRFHANEPNFEPVVIAAQIVAEQGRRFVANVLLDGRNAAIVNRESGNFIRPTILDGLPSTSALVDTEIFGPVLSLVHAGDMDEALAILEHSPFGNQASLFTSSGAAARRFRYEAPAGNIGINIGVAAPMAYFPFTGWKDSFFGDLHGQGRDSVEFYTDKKVVVERWGKEHSRKF